MTSLVEIEKATKAFADARAEVRDVVDEMNQQIEAIKSAKMKLLRSLVSQTASRHGELKALVEGAPDLFVKPRTVVFHGVKVGFQKGKGGIEIVDAHRTVELIKKHFPVRGEDWLIVTESPNKKALEQLPVHDLKRIGCNVVDATDAVVIKPVDGDVEKVVAALIKDATEEEV